MIQWAELCLHIIGAGLHLECNILNLGPYSKLWPQITGRPRTSQIWDQHLVTPWDSFSPNFQIALGFISNCASWAAIFSPHCKVSLKHSKVCKPQAGSSWTYCTLSILLNGPRNDIADSPAWVAGVLSMCIWAQYRQLPTSDCFVPSTSMGLGWAQMIAGFSLHSSSSQEAPKPTYLVASFRPQQSTT